MPSITDDSPSDSELRRCIRCGLHLHPENYALIGRGRRRRADCKDCRNKGERSQRRRRKDKIKMPIYEAQGGRCAGCQTRLEIRHLTIDHVNPRAAGGEDDISNYALLCLDCNTRKHVYTMQYLRGELLREGVGDRREQVRVLAARLMRAAGVL